MGSTPQESVQAGLATPERVLDSYSDLQPSNLPTFQPFRPSSCHHGRVQDQAELPRGLRGAHQQTDQYGVLRLLRLPLDVVLLQPGRPGMKLMEYQTKRGGRCVFQDIAKPCNSEWGTPLEAMEAALELEKTVNQSLLDLHKVAGDKGDGHLCDFLESEYLAEQVEGIKAIGDLIVKMKRAGDGLGLYLIDKEMGS